jgi:inorganic phosphate transporter, PiT family
MSEYAVLFVLFIVMVALAFDFLNGMNDAANSIATVVSTRVLSPKIAVAWAAFFNFAAFLIFGLHVANTIGKGIVEQTVVDEFMVLSALSGAVVWVYFCTHFGLPISVSHSLIGGLVGAALVKGGASALVLGEGWGFLDTKLFQTIIYIAFAPLLGLVLGYLMMVITYWAFKKSQPSKVDKLFRVGQLMSSAAFSLGHGANDAQKTMGIIAILLFSAREMPFVREYLYDSNEFYVPFWVVISAHTAIALGTLIGGWKVIKTMGVGITHLKPVGGFCAETAGAITLFGVSAIGVPVSTTHTISGAIMGVGTTRRLSAVRWGLAGNILKAWVLTIPAAAGVSGLTYFLLEKFFS